MIRINELSLAAATSAALLTGCGDSDSSTDATPTQQEEPSASDVAREASRAANTAGEFAEAKVDEYVASARDGVETINASIRTLAQRVENMSGEAKLEAERTLEDLRQKRDAYLEDLDEASADSAQAWQDVKSGLDKAWNDLESATESAVDRFGEQDGESSGAG